MLTNYVVGPTLLQKSDMQRSELCHILDTYVLSEAQQYPRNADSNRVDFLLTLYLHSVLFWMKFFLIPGLEYLAQQIGPQDH